MDLKHTKHSNLVFHLQNIHFFIVIYSYLNTFKYLFPLFYVQVKDIYSYLKLEQKRRNIKYSLSYQSMTLYPDYINRLNVLRNLRYIDDHDTGM